LHCGLVFTVPLCRARKLRAPHSTYFSHCGCLLIQLLLLCHPKPLFGFRKSEIFKWGVTAASCMARLLVSQASGRFQFFGITLRGASCPKKVSKHLNSTFHFNIKEVKSGLIFCLSLLTLLSTIKNIIDSTEIHCIKKQAHTCKTLYLRNQKTGIAPRVPKSTEVATCLFHSHLLRPPSIHSQGGSRPPNYALSKIKSLFLRS